MLRRKKGQWESWGLIKTSDIALTDRSMRHEKILKECFHKCGEGCNYEIIILKRLRSKAQHLPLLEPDFAI